jgi:hypothetical protein
MFVTVSFSCQETIKLAVDLGAYATVGLAHVSCNPLLVHVQKLVGLRTMLQVLCCASFTVAQVLKRTSEASCVSRSFKIAPKDAFSTVSKSASLLLLLQHQVKIRT